MNIDRYFE
jgi:hypothetical protein